MNVLSLFDGMSCGQLALEKAGITYDKYYASEINEESIKITQHNYPKTIQVGNVEELMTLDNDGYITNIGDTLKNLPKIDILIGGSPCQGLSRAKSGRLNLDDPRSKLFFNYIQIRDWLIQNNNPNLLWLLENVVPNKETHEIMNEVVGVDSVYINSSSFVAQDRPRLYWTNINIDLSKLPCESDKTISDIMMSNQNEIIKNLKEEGYENTIKWGKNSLNWDTSGKGYYSQASRARYMDSKMNTLPKSNSGDKTRIFLGEDNNGIYYRNATVEELEVLQGVPVGYTNIIKAKGKRRGIIGDGWTVDVIAWIFSFI